MISEGFRQSTYLLSSLKNKSLSTIQSKVLSYLTATRNCGQYFYEYNCAYDHNLGL